MVQIARVYNLTVLVANLYPTYPSEPKGDNAIDKIVPFNTELRRLVGGLQNVRIVDLYESFGTTAYGTYVGLDGEHPRRLATIGWRRGFTPTSWSVPCARRTSVGSRLQALGSRPDTLVALPLPSFRSQVQRDNMLFPKA